MRKCFISTTGTAKLDVDVQRPHLKVQYPYPVHLLLIHNPRADSSYPSNYIWIARRWSRASRLSMSMLKSHPCPTFSSISSPSPIPMAVAWPRVGYLSELMLIGKCFFYMKSFSITSKYLELQVWLLSGKPKRGNSRSTTIRTRTLRHLG